MQSKKNKTNNSFSESVANYYLGNMASACLDWRTAEELGNIDASNKISRYYR
jgi:hypothetical protein